MVYRIKKGCHYSFHWPKFHFGKTNLKVSFILGYGCWFVKKDPCDHAVNKLIGLSNGLHHQNSVRCGWTPATEPGLIDLFFYTYIDGIRTIKPFATIKQAKKYELEIDMSGREVSFKLNEPEGPSTLLSVFYKRPWFTLGYYLFPYFGGAYPAKADTYIDVAIK